MQEKSISHSSNSFKLSSVRLLERMAYYGIRSMLVLHMSHILTNLSTDEITAWYDTYSASILALGVIGALVGDFLLGNRKTVIIGGVFQACGAFILAFPNELALFTGCALLAIGIGLNTPNFLSYFGQQYLNKKELLPAGFQILLTFVNVGAFLGSIVFGMMYINFGFSISFIIGGVLLFVSTILFAVLPTQKAKAIEKAKTQEISNKSVLLLVLLLFLANGAFFHSIKLISKFSQSAIYESLVEFDFQELFSQIFLGSTLVLGMFLGIITAVIWTYRKKRALPKLIAGLLILLVSISIVFMQLKEDSNGHIYLAIINSLLLIFAEAFILPIIYALSTKYIPTKFNATFFSVLFLGTNLIAYLSTKLFNVLDIGFIVETKIELVMLGVLLLFLIIGLIILFKKMNPQKHSTYSEEALLD